MKKLFLSALIVASALFASAQKQDSTSLKSASLNGNNELKLNLIYAIAGFPEINYERILKDDMSVGVAVIIGLEKSSEYKFGIIPNYRVYFGNKKANGFFIEGNAAVISSTSGGYYAYDYSTNMNNYFSDKTQTSFGLGAAAGAKFLTKNGFVGEVYLGAGRLFQSNSDAYPRAGITIGKRF
ncbi:hypothetical protein ACVWYN_000286 [Pedobacter sp. UYP24]